MVIMTFLWSATSFIFYLSKFQVKTVAGDVFKNSATGTILDSVSKLICCLMFMKFPIKTVLVTFYIISSLASAPIIFSEFAGE